MPPLDPNRYVFAVLADATHRLPMPNGRFFDASGQLVDLHDPFSSMLLQDGSIRRASPPADDAPVDADAALAPHSAPAPGPDAPPTPVVSTP